MRLTNLSSARFDLTATVLQSGKVLIVGGSTQLQLGGSGTDTVELFDPKTRTFTKATSLGVPRSAHTATLLADGKVLVTGGIANLSPTASAEVYDPASDSWRPVAAMSVPRSKAAAVRLNDGSVLLIGGLDEFPVTPRALMAERYDVSTDSWQRAGTMAYTRPDNPTATLLQDGRVLVVGGRYLQNSPDAGLERSEIYDPKTNSWCATQADNHIGARSGQSATLLANGRVLVAGGVWASCTRQADLYDPATNMWIGVPNMTDARCNNPAVTLPSGNVMVIGGVAQGVATGGVEVFDPAGNTWSSAPGLPTARIGIAAAVLADGSVLAAGGIVTPAQPTAAAELFVPAG